MKVKSTSNSITPNIRMIYYLFTDFKTLSISPYIVAGNLLHKIKCHLEVILHAFLSDFVEKTCSSFRLLQFNLRVDGLKVCAAIYSNEFCGYNYFYFLKCRWKSLTDLYTKWSFLCKSYSDILNMNTDILRLFKAAGVCQIKTNSDVIGG